MPSTDAAPPSWGDLLARAKARLSGRQFAPYEAEELLARASGRPRAWFFARRREAADAEAAASFERLVAARESGAPLQYLLGEWEFLGRTFAVDGRALIPRGETEGIVEEARRAAPAASRILDLGTGSGVLAVTLAIERPSARVLALDLSVAALALAASNARRHGVRGRVAFAASDWLSAIRPRPRFDLAVANPPYVPLADEPHLSKTVSEFEPPLALYGGDDGLEPLRALLAALPAVLERGAPFVFEFGYSQASRVSALVEASGSFRLERVRLDPAGIPRTATAILVGAPRLP